LNAANVILWRHGQTDYNAAGKLQGQIDIPLNVTGIEQANGAAAVLAKVKPAAIVSSDLSRAVDTAAALAERIGLEPMVDKRLRERSFGQWEGLTHKEMSKGWPEAFAQWRTGGHPAGVDAETRENLGLRFAESVNEWAAKYEISDTVIFVAHGAAISTGITALLGQNPEGWRGISGLSNCHWSVLQPYQGDPQWRLTQHNVGAP